MYTKAKSWLSGDVIQRMYVCINFWLIGTNLTLKTFSPESEREILCILNVDFQVNHFKRKFVTSLTILIHLSTNKPFQFCPDHKDDTGPVVLAEHLSNETRARLKQSRSQKEFAQGGKHIIIIFMYSGGGWWVCVISLCKTY